MSVLAALKDLTDPRRSQAQRYEMPEIVFCVLISQVCDCNSYRDCETFIKENLPYLKEKLKLSWKDPPSYSTIRRIIIQVDTEELSDILRKHALEYTKQIKDSIEHISIDGKTVRRSYDNISGEKASHMLNVLDVTHGIVLKQINVTKNKTNEIPVAQKFLDESFVKNCIISLDALHCQKRTLSKTLKSGNNLLVQVKDNQKSLHKICKFRVCIHRDCKKYQTKVEKGHGRIESRTVKVFVNNKQLLPHGYKRFKSIILVSRHRKVLNTKTNEYESSLEDSYYLCSRELSPEKACTLIRQHWSVENRLHNVLDNSFDEDGSRIRVHPENIMLLRLLALNILRMNGKKNIRNARKSLSWNRHKLAKLKFLWS